MQIKADVLGLPISVVNEPEAALLGAALLAGVGAGVFHSQAEALQAAGTRAIQTYSPSPSSHDDYRQLYEDVYQRVIEPLRAFDHRRAQMQPVREEAQH
jgi:xylulokinase